MAQIGVVIPAYNASRFLASTLDSVQLQSFSDWTCIIVDDGSTDDTLAIAEVYARQDKRIQVVSVANGGQARARNLGARILGANVRYLAFLDADDVWMPHTLMTLHAHLEECPSAVGAAGIWRDLAEDGTPVVDDYKSLSRIKAASHRRGIAGWRLVPLRRDDPTGLATLAVWLHIPTPGLALIRQEAFHQTLGFRGITSPSEDWDFFLQLSRLGPILHVPKTLLDKRIVAGSESQQPGKMKQAEPAMRRLWVQQEGVSADERRILVLGHLYGSMQRFSWAWEEARHGDYMDAVRHATHGVLALGRFARIEGLERMTRPKLPTNSAES